VDSSTPPRRRRRPRHRRASPSLSVRVLGGVQCPALPPPPARKLPTRARPRRRVVIHWLTRDFGTVTRVWARRATRVRFLLLEAAAQTLLLPLLQLACARRLQCRPKVDEMSSLDENPSLFLYLRLVWKLRGGENCTFTALTRNPKFSPSTECSSAIFLFVPNGFVRVLQRIS